MLKRTFAAAVMLACVPLAHADDFCQKMSHTASVAMSARQDGVPLRDLIASVRGKNGGKEQPYEPMIFEAYKRPLVQGKEAKTAAATEFGNETYMVCMKKMK